MKNNSPTFHTPHSTFSKKQSSTQHPVPKTQNKNNSSYFPIVGLEIHAELKTKSKMFCGCKNDPFHAEKPNIYTCPVCLGMPGGLPIANKKAVEWTIKLGLALNCKINLFSKFDRKNYFYPDLAKGYQISQYDIPLCEHGVIETEEGPVRIRRIHLEEDTGKLQHRTIPTNTQNPEPSTQTPTRKVSLIDFNRGGVPLIEIVTEPDIHSAQHAKAYAKKLRQILRYLDISDCDMEQGSMRLEANISLLHTPPTTHANAMLGVLPSEEEKEIELPNYKVEVKNINSFNFLAKAIDFEIARHQDLLENGKTPEQETRGWDEDHNETFSQRSKEDAEDYRYFPDPDLPPMRFTEKQIEKIKSEIPELPDSRQVRWQAEFGIEEKYARVLVETPEQSDFADKLFSLAKKGEMEPNAIANAWVNKKVQVKFSDDPQAIVDNYKQATAVDEINSEELHVIIQEVLKENPDAVENYRNGKVQIIGFLIGQTMKKLGKKVNPKEIKTALETELQ